MTIRQVALFDLDGTLTAPRQRASKEMLVYLSELRQRISIGVVSGSDLVKITEQLGCNPQECFDYVFSENGVVAHDSKALIGTNSISQYLGEDKLKELINFVLRYFSEIEIPVKRGTFIEYRTGMLNFSPVGRACNQQERIQFFEYDKEHKIREKFVAALKQRFPADSYGLQFSIGGQISVDCFPVGWDKTYCLRYFNNTDEIHFFGDMTHPGGNDHEIFVHDRTIGHTVTDPEDTIRQLSTTFPV